ncbi:MAG: SF0329 family protein [Thermoleophilia bacterium]
MREVGGWADESDLDFTDPRVWSSFDEAGELLARKAVFHQASLHDALTDYLSLSIDDALASTHPVTRALAVLDRRTGKRRLRDFPFMADEHPVVRMLHQVRCEAEGIGTPPDPVLDASLAARPTSTRSGF